MTQSSQVGLDNLCQYMWRVGPQESPRHYSNTDAGAGLCFLDLAINRNHVVEETEVLSLTDRNFLSRQVSVDMSLSLLTPSQYRTSAAYNEMRYAPGEPSQMASEPRPGLAETRAATIWLPVLQLDRLVTSDLAIRGEAGALLPQISQAELVRMKMAALIQVFKTLVKGERQLRGTHIDLRKQWIAIEAIAHYIQFGSPSEEQTSADGRKKTEAAVKVMRGLCEEYWGPFFSLLHKTGTEFTIVAGLDSSKSDHTVSYRAPDLPNRRSFPSRRAFCRYVPLLGPLTTDRFIVKYIRESKTSLRSFHISLETEYDLDVRSAQLISERDTSTANEIQSQLRAVAQNVKDNSHPKELLEHEEYRLLSAAQQLVYRRSSQLLRAKGIRERSIHTGPDDVIDSRPRDSPSFLSAFKKVRQEKTPASSTRPEAVAKFLDDYGIGLGVVTSDDPRRNYVHAFWRVLPSQLTSRTATKTHNNTFVAVLADDRPSLMTQVSALMSGLLAIVCCLGALLLFLGEQTSLSAPNAAVTILLLVPGLMLSRLETASGDRVLTWLRRPARNHAYAGVAVTTALSAVVATVGNKSRDLIAIAFASSAVLLTLLCLTTWLALLNSGRRKRANRPPDSLTVPWLTKWFYQTSRVSFLARRYSRNRPANRNHKRRETRPWLRSKPGAAKAWSARTLRRIIDGSGERVEDALFDATGAGPQTTDGTEDHASELIAAVSSNFLLSNARILVVSKQEPKPVKATESSTLATSLQSSITASLPNSPISQRPSEATPEQERRQRQPTETEVWASSGPATAPVVNIVATATDRTENRPGEGQILLPRASLADYEPRVRLEIYVASRRNSDAAAEILAKALLVVARQAAPTGYLAYCGWPSACPSLDSTASFSDSPAQFKYGFRVGFDLPRRKAGEGYTELLKLIAGLDSEVSLFVRDQRATGPAHWVRLQNGSDKPDELDERIDGPDKLISATIVGPLRKGTTKALIEGLQKQRYKLRGLTEKVMGGYSVMTFWVAGEITTSGQTDGDATLRAYRAAFSEMVKGRSTDDSAETFPLRKFTVLQTSVVDLAPEDGLRVPQEHTPKGLTDVTAVSSIWCVWSLPQESAAFVTLADTLREALGLVEVPDGSTLQPNDLAIRYLDGRLASPGRLVGQARLLLSSALLEKTEETAKPKDKEASTFCRDLELRWRELLQRKCGPGVELQVVWRDTWIPDWAYRR